VARDPLLRESDIVSIHAPLNDRTHHMLGKEQFKRMKREATFVNPSWGGVVDTAALYEAVKYGLIRAAALDVHEHEPVPIDYALCELESVILSDHIGWYPEEAQIELQTKVPQAIASVLTGTLPKSVVNREPVARRRQPEGASRGTAVSAR
jgi:D-3-phosphoglycerate dehydrogenase